MNNAQKDSQQIFLDKIVFSLLENFLKEIKSFNDKRVLKKDPEKIILSSLDVYNCIESRIFKTPNKTIISFLLPGIKPNSIKYSIRKIRTMDRKYKHVLIVTGKYDVSLIKRILGKDYSNTIVYRKKNIAIPNSEFSAQFELDKKIWDFNNIEKIIENGVLYLILNKKFKTKEGTRHGK